ncbi:MAG: DMT family protein [Haliscomenobacter sp.]
MSRGLLTILLLVLSNAFMTLAWYGHLKFSAYKNLAKLGLFTIILLSWGIAFFEYCFQVPANRLGFKGNGGPFSLLELKVLQEVITLVVFTAFSLLVFRQESFRWNHLLGFGFLVLAVYFIFKR